MESGACQEICGQETSILETAHTKAEIVFADEKLKQAFNKLKESKTEDKQLYELLKRALKT